MRTHLILVVSLLSFGLIALTGCTADRKEPVAPVTANVAAPSQGPNYLPIPDPATDEKGLDFGTLLRTSTENGVVTLHVNRETFYTGAEAIAHHGGRAVLDDFVVDDPDGDRELTFVLDPKASLQAEAYLRTDGDPNNERQTLTVAELVRNAGRFTPGSDPAGDLSPLVWLRHTGGPDGPVTALADQFVP